ncbi:MAG: Flp pilus assembly protein CpaB, partial [Actinomycetota bacterium]|nr:Flp pilus assembly protein CpaB [Actinomycetota bacterium]
MRLSRFFRFRLSRSPLAFWVAVALLALATASVVAKLVGRADALAGRYGPLRPVVVAARAVDRGVELAQADIAVRRLPATFLPDGAFGSAEDVVGRTAVAPLVVGQLVLRGHLAPDGLSGVAALLPAGTRGVALPAEGGPGLVRRGDLVDVLATFDPSLTGGGEPTVAVAVGALVVDVGADVVTVAVLPEEARRIAFAVAHATITLAVTPGLGGEGPAGTARAD